MWKDNKGTGNKEERKAEKDLRKECFSYFFWQPAIAAPRPFRSSKYILGFCDQNRVMNHCRNQGWQGDKKIWDATSIWGSYYFGMLRSELYSRSKLTWSSQISSDILMNLKKRSRSSSQAYLSLIFPSSSQWSDVSLRLEFYIKMSITYFIQFFTGLHP